ncbi:MAG TPA: hypothetical protein VN688_08490 [Gemmataceae bacterium]|nr:hypothetical protein [Gemmataceae bacterium]
MTGCLLGPVPVAHSTDMLRDDGSAVGQVGGDVLAEVARGHGPFGEELSGVFGREPLEPDQVGGQEFKSLRAGAIAEDAQIEEFLCVSKGMDSVQQLEVPLPRQGINL